MNKYRFREYDALGLQRKVPGEKVASVNHISKRKQKQKDVEVVFDVKDYREYVTGFRKRKQQRRQDALKHIKEKQRQERNQQRSEKRTKLKEELGLGDDYGVGTSSDDDEDKDANAQPQSITVYKGDGGMTTTVTTMTLQSNDDEQLVGADSSEDEEAGGSADDGERQDAAEGLGPSSSRRKHFLPGGKNGSGKHAAKQPATVQKAKNKQADKQGSSNPARLKSKGGVQKGRKKGADKKRHR